MLDIKYFYIYILCPALRTVTRVLIYLDYRQLYILDIRINNSVFAALHGSLAAHERLISMLKSML